MCFDWKDPFTFKSFFFSYSNLGIQQLRISQILSLVSFWIFIEDDGCAKYDIILSLLSGAIPSHWMFFQRFSSKLTQVCARKSICYARQSRALKFSMQRYTLTSSPGTCDRPQKNCTPKIAHGVRKSLKKMCCVPSCLWVLWPTSFLTYRCFFD